MNPFLSVESANKLLASCSTLLRLNRVAHARRALAALARLRSLLDKAVTAPSDDAVTKVSQAAKALTAQLVSERHYAVLDGANQEGKIAILDPRFSVFEYAFDLLLRSRQVEMVRSFAAFWGVACSTNDYGSG